MTPAAFAGNPLLSMNYRILSTNLDRQGVQFISSMEHQRVPIYAVQFHPERPAFEWNDYEHTPHSLQAVLRYAASASTHCHGTVCSDKCANSAQYFANFFVQEARRSLHAFPNSQMEQAHLMYWCQLSPTLDIDWYSEESYFFPNYNGSSQCHVGSKRRSVKLASNL